MTSQPEHIPVLVNEVVQGLAPTANEIYVDATFGRGGYTRALLNKSPQCMVIGIDRDPEAVAVGKAMEQEYKDRFRILEGTFGQIESLLENAAIGQVNGVAFDLGVSSPQIDTPERGFSFRHDGPLDMRMSRSGTSAADLVNEMREEDLANIIYQYGEERASRRIAKAIVEQRKVQPFTRTLELAQAIEKVVPRRDETHPATKTFQALRIAVNGELDELEKGLQGAENVLADQGRLAVVTFHSLEDRIVKTFLRRRAGKESRGSRHRPDMAVHAPVTFRIEQNKAIAPSKEEEKRNPRARSSKLRVAIRVRGENAYAA